MKNAHNNLNLFRTLFLIKGILTLCFSLFFIIYSTMGLFVSAAIESDNSNHDIPFNFGYIFVFIGIIGLIICVTFGILTLVASKYIKEIRKYNFIFAIAILNCFTGFLGILLGVFTLIELNKTEVKQLFNKS